MKWRRRPTPRSDPSPLGSVHVFDLDSGELYVLAIESIRFKDEKVVVGAEMMAQKSGSYNLGGPITIFDEGGTAIFIVPDAKFELGFLPLVAGKPFYLQLSLTLPKYIG